ncbi:laminin subunit gamma-2 [Microcaecilia unicolor]|uniref:Laminin subunit gamma-2 n=1 Tax=Microcaecilia unicolor TaxID=1415580 RepID=A0A6P7YC71_9AMPH|nr:laminin subunit gamma-2 [Microcaecilia unicolor]
MACCRLVLTLSCCFCILFIAVNSQREECYCNGKATTCTYDKRLQALTRNGFRCFNCHDNTAGVHCERCKEGYHRLRDGDRCLPCNCSPRGSLSTQCDNYGRCHCKPGVTGEKCDRCQHGSHYLTEAGCIGDHRMLNSNCNCDPAGSAGHCDLVTGRCVCKASVTGDRCDRCKSGYYNLDARNPEGCTQCFCYGHSSSCSSAGNYSMHRIIASFQKDSEGWRAVQRSGDPVQLHWSPHHHDVYVTARHADTVYFTAPAKFLGDQRLSYGQVLSFDYRLDQRGRRASAHDVVLEGAGLQVTAPLTTAGDILPCGLTRSYTFRLNEQSSSKWSPQLSSFEFHRLLRNLTTLHIRGTYGQFGRGYLDNVTLVSAQPLSGPPAPWVEQCVCPPGYHGQFCERCGPGYKRTTPSLGPFSACVPCSCQGGGVCDPDTGDCYSGDQNLDADCADCSIGFYNDPQDPRICRRCPCQDGFGCSVNPTTQDVVCNSCPLGVTGVRCNLCADGYFGDPLGENGPIRPCQPCSCNNNIDPRASGNCDRTTGECLKCIYNTGGFYCDRCKTGFIGNPLASEPADKCRACNCHAVGAESQVCGPDGSCRCKPGYEGLHCEYPLCPACYGEVRNQVDQHRRQLRDLETLVSQVQTGGLPVKKEELEGKMVQAEKTVQGMLREAEISKASDQSLQNRLSKVKEGQSTTQSRFEEAKRSADRVQSLAREYQGQMEETRKLIEKARLELEKSNVALKDMHVPPLDIPSGPNAFLSMAQDAQGLSERHTQEADLVVQIAKAAQDDSNQALQLLRSATTGGGSLGTSVQDLLETFNEAKSSASALETKALGLASAAERANRDSLQMFHSVSQLPAVNTGSLQEDTDRIKQKADTLTSVVDGHMTDYRKLQQNLENWEEDVKNLFLDGESRRRLADQLMSRANLAKNQALQALSTGNATFYEVENILKHLRGFNLQVDDRKAEAEDAMRRLPEIRRKVDAANATTLQAELALGSAATVVQEAYRMANEAQDISSETGLGVGRLNLEVNGTTDRVLTLERAVAGLMRKAGEAEGELETKLLAATGDAAAVQMIFNDAQSADTGARNAKTAVEETLNALNNVLIQLEQPWLVDEKDVNMLESSLSAARNTITSRLRPNMMQLEEMAERQRSKILFMEKNIDQILLDIENLEEIRRALPPNCYNLQPIERP